MDVSIFKAHYLAMTVSSRIGLFVKNAQERQILRTAALACGLEPVDLHDLNDLGASAPSKPDITLIGAPINIPTDRSLQFIVTDQDLPAPDDKTFPAAPSPLMILVKDIEQNDGATSEDNLSRQQHATYEWVLSRPLRAETVLAQLRQAAQANRFFAERNHLLTEELHLSRRIFDSVCNGITICDVSLPDLPLVYINPAFERITGYTSPEVCGRNCRFLQGPDTEQPGLTVIRQAIRERREARVLLKNYRKDGNPFWNELYLSPVLDLAGRLTHFVGIQNDVTAQVESEQRLTYLAHHDSLTGLVNRGQLIENINLALLRAKRTGKSLAVLFLDLDNFKHVNDVFGHDAGDNLLKIVAERLRASARAFETVARLGGDEFVIVLEDLDGDRQPTKVVERLVATIHETIQLFEQPFHPSASVGLALFPGDADTPEGLLKVADFNMYVAKHKWRQANQIQDEDARSSKESRT